ncbi:MAG: zinc ABC transporter substrate-binding protein, partial [Rhizobiaceae bacterium]
PVHSLVAAVMKGAGSPALLVEGHASPHTYALKPSGAAALARADIIFRIGPDMETFLNGPLDALGGKAMVVDLATAPGLTLLPYRKSGVFDDDDHDEAGHEDHHAGDHDESAEADHDDGDDDDGHHHHHGSTDMHLWLDPHNARPMIERIAGVLKQVDPGRAGLYAANAAAAMKSLDALGVEIARQLEPLHDRHFLVFHDAYHYFENRFGLEAAGSIAANPQNPPGAETVAALEAMVARGDVVCAFVEPQFSPKLVEAIAGQGGIRIGTLDPLGAAIDPGPEQYGALMRDMATAFAKCLGG